MRVAVDASSDYNWNMTSRSTPLLLTLLSVLALSPHVGAESEAHYEYKEPSRDGIGKVYMGREISFVLGHSGIRWLERPERVNEEKPDRLIELLDLAPDSVIADIDHRTQPSMDTQATPPASGPGIRPRPRMQTQRPRMQTPRPRSQAPHLD